MDCIGFEDFLPTMADRLGAQGLMQEMQKGFYLLADPSSQTITLESLKQNAALLGMPMSECELCEIMRLGDLSNRGELDLHQFCVAMFRTSPGLMDQALEMLLLDALSEEEEEGEQGSKSL